MRTRKLYPKKSGPENEMTGPSRRLPDEHTIPTQNKVMGTMRAERYRSSFKPIERISGVSGISKLTSRGS